MKRSKNSFLRTGLILLALIPFACFAHFIIFPQESRAILIAFSGFNHEGKLYYEPSSAGRIPGIRSQVLSARSRVTIFWGELKADPAFIYCVNESDFRKYSASPDAPAVTYCKLGGYIVLSRQGADIDIIAHEISHAEFYKRVGFYAWTFRIPDWFKHGLAMQNDYRKYYSSDTLKSRTNNFKTMPDIRAFKTGAQFFSGTADDIMIRYMTAKYVVGIWYTRQKLAQLIRDLNDGKSFDEAFHE